MNIMSRLLFKNNGVYAWFLLFTSCWGVFICPVHVMHDNHLNQIAHKYTTVIWQGSTEQAIKQLTGPQWIIWDSEGCKGYASCAFQIWAKESCIFLLHVWSLWNRTGLVCLLQRIWTRNVDCGGSSSWVGTQLWWLFHSFHHNKWQPTGSKDLSNFLPDSISCPHLRLCWIRDFTVIWKRALVDSCKRAYCSDHKWTDCMVLILMVN